MTEKRVLFLCIHNSCRSQLAEAMVNHDLADQWQAFSAGTEPSGCVHPLAIKVLEEIGIHHQGSSKSIQQFYGENFDLVVTICDDTVGNIPIWRGAGKKLHLNFPDPARATGSEDEVIADFRAVRDDIRMLIIGILKDYLPESAILS